VIAVVPNPTCPGEGAIRCARRANRETLNAAAERRSRIGLHDQVDVVFLN
jgi:hypothetical protein